MAGHEVYLHGQILGTHIGTEVAPLLKDFYRNKTVDLSSLFFDSEENTEDKIK